MLDIKKFLSEHRLDSVSYKHENYGMVFVTCILKPSYYKDVPVSACSMSEEESTEQALSLLHKVRELKIKLEIPQIDIKNGNKRVVIKKEDNINTVVNFKNNDGLIAVTNLYLEDDNGFIILDKPIPVDSNIYQPYQDKHVSDYFIDDEVPLKPNEKLYCWNTIYGLSGSAGLAIVDDSNQIIKMKTILIS